MPVKAQLLIPAAGMGVRLGAAIPKALIPIGDRPLLAHTLDAFQHPDGSLDLLEGAIIVVPTDHRALFEECLAAHFPSCVFRVVVGGLERQDSVGNGLACLNRETEVVVIHDAARPGVSREAIGASIEAAAIYGGSTVAVPCVDTILEADDDQFLATTPDRSRLWACQTPQTFRVDVIRAAHAAARRTGVLGTDDATLVRLNGGRVKLIMGSYRNLKITNPDDILYAQSWLLDRGSK